VKKVLISLMTVIFMASLVLSMNAIPASADFFSWSIVKSGKVHMVPGVGCYKYEITYTYTITNDGGSDIVLEKITDSNPEVDIQYTAGAIISGFGGTLDCYGYYDATQDVINGVVSLSNTATVYGNSEGTEDSAVSNQFTIPLPHFDLPTAWYLNEIPNYSGNDMEWVLDGGKHIQSGGVLLDSNTTQTWFAYSVAPAGGITYNSGNWTFLMHTPEEWTTPPEVYFGEWTVGGFTAQKFGPFSIAHANWNPANFTYTATINVPDQISVSEGHYLAVQITNSNSKTEAIATCHRVGGAYLEPPEPKPNWPVPEMPTGILLGIGLAGIGVFIMIKQKKSGKTV
jgi:hypothetical protein